MKCLLSFGCLLILCSWTASCSLLKPERKSALEGKVICLDPGHGGTADTDQFRVGPSGEREEWVNLRVAKHLREILENRGAMVAMTRTEDVPVGLKERADLARAVNADVFLSIHHNATADPEVNFPIVYYHAYGSQNQAGVALAEDLAQHLNKKLFDNRTEPSVCSDYVIFSRSGTGVLRHSYGIPGVIGEASFFSNPAEEERLKSEDYNLKEAEAYADALESFFSREIPPVLPKDNAKQIEPFRALQEADRMSEVAKLWDEDYRNAVELMEQGEPRDLERAYELLTRSVRSFPDSNVARECHILRSQILREWGEGEKATEELRRAEEFYKEM